MEFASDVPEQVVEAFEKFDGVHIPEGLPVPERKIYMLGNKGKCMCCGGNLHQESLVVINATGLNQVYCSHKCNQDMNLLGYLSQQYDDIKQGVQFRGNAGRADASNS